jgi:ABC-type proline/glycine betaine transport system ATPase subunit
MITHDTSEAVFLADRIAVMHAGRIVTTGTPHELMTAEQPYVRELMQTPRRHAARLAGLMQRNAPDA